MEEGKRLAKSTLAIVIFSLIGKIFGYFREILSANYFGATKEMDSFVASQSVTTILAALVTTAIATTFIPSLQKAEKELGHEQKLIFTNNMLFVASITSIIMIILGVVFSPQLTLLLAPKEKLEVFDLVVKLVRIGMPVVIFSAILGVFTGFLQYENKFAAAGAVSIPLNLVYILYLVFNGKNGNIVHFTIASVLAVVAEVLFLLPFAIKSGFRPKFEFNFKDKYVIEAIILSGPVLLSTAINDINILVNRRLAMGMQEGSTTVINYANKLNLLILGVFITAITAIIFPSMSRAFGSGDIKFGKKVMNASVKTVLFLTIPSTVGMLILAKPIVFLSFFRGRFTLQNAIDTTATLRFYSFALVSISISNVLNRVYYSISDTKTPFYIGLINVLINVGLNLLVAHKFGTRGLAASVSISTIIAVLISFVLLKKKIGNLGTKSYVKAFIKCIMASSIMGAFCLVYYPIEALIFRFFGGQAITTLLRLIVLILVVGIAACIYAIILYLLGVREIRDIKNLVEKNLKKKRLKA